MTKALTSIVLLLMAIVSLSLVAMRPDTSDPIEKKIDDLLAKMTLDEKVGQMTQVTIQAVAKTKADTFHQFELDPEKLRMAVVDYNVGSLLNVYDVALTIDEWHTLITAIQDVATKETRLGIPVIYGIDAIHGANYTKDATLFPQSITMAATWRPDLVEKAAHATAKEVRASGIPWNFNPVLGVGRMPLWPRFWETFGECSYTVSVMGRAYVDGTEGKDNNVGADDRVAACMKHYLGYSVPLNGKDRTPAWIPERMLRDIFLPPFAAAVDAGVQTVMLNSAEINGIPTHSDAYVLNDILKGELKFDGFVVSDWEDIKRLHDRDRVAETPREAVRMAVMAGVDMSMVPYDFTFYDHLLDLAQKGDVPEERIDDAVRRILRVKFRTGLFENPYPKAELKKQFATKEHTQLSLDAAREAITLLKNDGNLLPLKKESKVLVTGPTSDMLSVLNGGWTITWQGNREELYPHEKRTIREAIEAKVGAENMTFAQGVDFDGNGNWDEVQKQAASADVIVMALGEAPYCETPGNINNLMLDARQIEFANKVYGLGKPVVIVLVEGRPRVVNGIAEKADAIVMAYLPGNEGGRALADILFGDVTPSGKLPFSYPADVNDFTNYDHKPIEKFDTNDYRPQWPFGYGLSYTTFEYSDLALDRETIGKEDKLQIRVKVKNSGQREGKEVVHLYVTDMYGSVSRPVRMVRGFQKIALKPGEVREVTFELKPADLAFTGRDNKKRVEAGDFVVNIGGLEAGFRYN